MKKDIIWVFGLSLSISANIIISIMLFQILFQGVTTWIEPNLMILITEIILTFFGIFTTIYIGVDHYRNL